MDGRGREKERKRREIQSKSENISYDVSLAGSREKEVVHQQRNIPFTATDIPYIIYKYIIKCCRLSDDGCWPIRDEKRQEKVA